MYALEEKQIRRPDILENRINADKNCLLFEVLYKGKIFSLNWLL